MDEREGYDTVWTAVGVFTALATVSTFGGVVGGTINIPPFSFLGDQRYSLHTRAYFGVPLIGVMQLVLFVVWRAYWHRFGRTQQNWFQRIPAPWRLAFGPTDPFVRPLQGSVLLVFVIVPAFVELVAVRKFLGGTYYRWMPNGYQDQGANLAHFALPRGVTGYRYDLEADYLPLVIPVIYLLLAAGGWAAGILMLWRIARGPGTVPTAPEIRTEPQ